MVYLPGHGEELVEIRRFEDMDVGVSMMGPCIVESPVTTVVVDPGATVERRPTGTLSVVPGSNSNGTAESLETRMVSS
jgi:N-methylhydantoinase A